MPTATASDTPAATATPTNSPEATGTPAATVTATDPPPAKTPEVKPGTLTVLKDCLIPGPDGKVVFPPPPEGNFELTLYRGTSTLQSLNIEEVIDTFHLVCGATRTFTLGPATYNVFEFNPDPGSGFGQIANFCVNVEVEAGQAVSCNLTNEKFPSIVPPSTGGGGIAGSSSGGDSEAWFGLASLLTGLGLLVWQRRQSDQR
jgi:hypothetical protein